LAAGPRYADGQGGEVANDTVNLDPWCAGVTVSGPIRVWSRSHFSGGPTSGRSQARTSPAKRSILAHSGAFWRILAHSGALWRDVIGLE